MRKFLILLLLSPSLWGKNLPSWDEAWALADKYDPGLHHTHAIWATRSMYPVLDWDSIVIMEDAPFRDLWIGDIVNYRIGKDATFIHRIVRRNPDGSFVVKGDSLNQADTTPLTPQNYISRAYMVIYYDIKTIPMDQKAELWKRVIVVRLPEAPERTVPSMYLSASAPRIRLP